MEHLRFAAIAGSAHACAHLVVFVTLTWPDPVLAVAFAGSTGRVGAVPTIRRVGGVIHLARGKR